MALSLYLRIALLLSLSATYVTAQVSGCSGPNTASVITTAPLAGSTHTWINTGNVIGSDDVYASTSTGFVNLFDRTDYLVVTGFSLNVPAGAVIDGFEIGIERSATEADRLNDNDIRIVEGGVIGGTNFRRVTGYQTSDSVVTYGSPTFLWGDTWVPADFNDPDFGIAYSVKRYTSASVPGPFPLVDNITIKVYWTIPLPVTNLIIDAKPDVRKILVNWQTDAEINTSHYNLQRSTDGENFVTIESNIPANGDTDAPSVYHKNDLNVTYDMPYYYRVEQFDRDGSRYMSETVEATLRKPAAHFLPNPASNGLILNIWTAEATQVSYKLFDAIGREVYSGAIQTTIGDNRFDMEPILNKLGSGTYTASIQAGSEVVYERLVLLGD